MAKIFVCGGIKGGTGKSITSINLATYLANKNHKVLLVDADDQQSSTDFVNARSESMELNFTAVQLTGKGLRKQVDMLSDNYDYIVIDTGGRDTTSQRSALIACDVLILPFAPRSFDLWTLDKVSELIDQAEAINEDLKAFAFLNRADPANRATDNESAKGIIKEYENITLLSSTLSNRKAFADSTATGLNVFEYRPKNIKAIEEMEQLFIEILKN